MQIPFSIDEFLSVFKNYNQAVWPVQVVLYSLAIIAIISIIRNRARSNQIVVSILAILWIWMGLVYHILFFSLINPAAYLFGTMFIIQGILFIYLGVIKQKIKFQFRLSLSAIEIIGTILIVYALILYPFLGYYAGHGYPMSPTFGVPCPTTIFTFGLLLFSVNRIPWYLIIIPFLWSLIGFFAAINLSIREDFGLVIAGLVSFVILVIVKPREGKAVAD